VTAATQLPTSTDAMAPASGAVVALEHVTKRYGRNAAPAVSDLSLTIGAGEICVLVGP
jgi:osmoprotectant transport system ATP-binding protein